MSNIDNAYEKLQALRDDINRAKAKGPTTLESCLSAVKVAALFSAGMAIGAYLKGDIELPDVVEITHTKIDEIVS